jgi:hypothetical protein
MNMQMNSWYLRATALLIGWALCMASAGAADNGVLPPVSERFAPQDVSEVPTLQRHVSPLLGRLGCNGRACHGSFQGQGGFRLSLFGYDFKADHDALLDPESTRVDLNNPADSLILNKPTSEDEHGGGLRYEKGGWEYHLLSRWIEDGAKYEGQISQLVRLEVTPSEILFDNAGQQVQLSAIAVWEDGTKEDVTPLCRFQTNNDQIAKISESGLVTGADPGDTHVVVFYDNGVVPIPVIRPVSDLAGPSYPSVPTPTKIDELVVEKLRKLGIVPAELASDAEFLRRVSLDMTGTLPTAKEVEIFLVDKSPNKRAAKIEQLLESPAYAAWWTTQLCDYTGNSDTALQNATAIRGRANQDWYDWIYKRIEQNVPYDELIAGIVLGVSRDPGESYMDYAKAMSDIYRDDSLSFADRECMPYYWARQNLRQPEERAIGFAYTFMGIRIQCAQCHKHPFDQWSKKDFEQFTGFFTRVSANNGAVSPEARDDYNALVADLGLDGQRGNQLRNMLPKFLNQGKTIPFPEVYVLKPRVNNANARRRRPPNAPAATAKLLGGDVINLNDYEDPRQPLMDWLRDPSNPFFARALVNRVWSTYFNVGIVQPADDLSLANPPSNKPLLDYLAQGFIDSGFDMKWLHREIANSRTYQLSWKPNDTNRQDEKNFSHAVARRLPAEVAYDALQQATVSDEKAEAMHQDMTGRAIAIAGSSARNQNNGPGYALSIFGRSIRESNCDCDRSTEASLLQTVYLQNDRDLLSMIDRGRGGWLDQVARQIGGKTYSTATDDRSTRQRPGDYQEVVARLEQRIRKLEKLNDSAQLARAEKQLADYKRRYKSATPAPVKKVKFDVASFDSAELVRQAYLRTLSRYPSDEELNRSQQYISESDDTLAGLRGVLWALLNTKEFIVNH